MNGRQGGRCPGPRAGAGFTLIELAVAIAVIGLLLGGLLLPLSTQVELNRNARTTKMLEDARDALYGFALVNGRLPCPDCPPAGACAGGTADDGVEDQSGGVCSVNEGRLPWATLGTSSTDAWGNAFIYRVTQAFADTAAPASTALCPSAPAGMSFHLCTAGDITVRVGAFDIGAGAVVYRDVTGVPAVLLSTGANGIPPGGSAPDEEENTDADTTFVSRPFSQQAGNAFDDIVLWISPHVLRNRFVQAGRLP